MNKTRFAAALLALGLVAGQAAAQQLPPLPQSIRDHGVLRAGVRCDQPPYGFRGSDGGFAGVDLNHRAVREERDDTCCAELDGLLHDEIHIFSLWHGLCERDRARWGGRCRSGGDFQLCLRSSGGCDHGLPFAPSSIKNSDAISLREAENVEAMMGFFHIECGGFPVFRSEMKSVHIF